MLWFAVHNDCLKFMPVDISHTPLHVDADVQIGIFNHVSYIDAFAIVWALCPSGVTMHFSKTLPVLGYGVRALQNIYLPKETDKTKQKQSIVQAIKQRSVILRHFNHETALVPENQLSLHVHGMHDIAALRSLPFVANMCRVLMHE